MLLELQDLAWHRSVGQLIEQLDKPQFWRSLVRLLNKYVTVDNWAALVFSNDQPHIIDFAEWTAKGCQHDPLVRDYVAGLYLLDPFYIANRDNQETGFFHLSDIAPKYFLQTEYYNRYFTHYVSVDEVQFNVQLDTNRTLCLSLGSKRPFKSDQIALLDFIRLWVIALMRQRINFELDLKKIKPRNHLQWQDCLEEAMLSMGTPLTSREIDVLRLLLSGFSNKEIAVRLTLSTETIKVHRRNLYAKLNINSQAGLFVLFFESTHRQP